MNNFSIHRRTLLKGAAATAALAAIHASGLGMFYPSKTYRVALIGTGWYGKNDLFRLIQVAPVNVVALCEVDKNQLAEAKKMVTQRLKTSKPPRLYNDYRKMLAENE